MPVKPINTPNLITELADIDTIESSISPPIGFNTYINPIFKLKPTQDCEALILHDYTDYEELYSVSLDEVTIVISYGLLSDCGCEIDYICEGISFTPNSQYVLNNLLKDGVYCVKIEIQYYSPFNADRDPQIIDVSTTINSSYKKDCCEKEYKNISRNVWGKMSDLACSISNLAKIGRNTKQKRKSYVKLSNLLYLYYYLSKDACEEKEKVLCAYNKIK